MFPIPTPITEAEKALTSWNVRYSVQPDGMIIVEGDLDIMHKELTRLPDLSKVIVKGSFYCNNNALSSLLGSPARVEGGYFCNNNKLTTLEGATQNVGKNFLCHFNDLISLAGAPRIVIGDFYCGKNKLTTLHGSPDIVYGGFACYDTPLVSLEGISSQVGGLYCKNTKLTSLEHIPTIFHEVNSDLGDYVRLEDMPDHVRFSPETIARRNAEEVAAKNALIKSGTIVQSRTPVMKKIVLKRN